MIFLMVASLVTIKTDPSVYENDSTTSSSNLISDIRRQLMANNYDYLPSEPEEDFPFNRFNVNDHTSPEKMIDDYDYHANDKLNFKVANEIAPRAHDDYEENAEDQRVAKKDLFYYMNDERMGLVEENVQHENDYKVTSPKVKYKLIKIKSGHPNRRSLTSRRFLEERGKDGVAIISLDDQPFPEFRLPKSRRQYMEETSDDDIPSNLAEDFSFEDANNTVEHSKQ